jgi:DNA-directed RNA polymerase subunit RPC12/RpoP
MVEIECLACGKTIKMPPYIDTEKYDGQVVCQKCNSLLHVKFAKEKVQKYEVVENKRERDVKLIFRPAHPKESDRKEKNLRESQREAKPL